MLITSTTKITTTIYDSVLDFEIEYIETYNLFRCWIGYDKSHASVAFVRPAIGFYIIKRLETIDTNRNSWIDTDRLLWVTINNLNWMN